MALWKRVGLRGAWRLQKCLRTAPAELHTLETLWRSIPWQGETGGRAGFGCYDASRQPWAVKAAAPEQKPFGYSRERCAAACFADRATASCGQKTAWNVGK
jgi:hypothetical protein